MKPVAVVGTLGIFFGLCLCSQAVLLPGGFGLDPTQAAGPAPLRYTEGDYVTGAFSGTIASWVTKDPANPLGGLSFYYQINSTGPNAVSEFSTLDFGLTPGATVEVSTIVAPYSFPSLLGGVLPTTANRSDGDGSDVNFLFNGAAEIGADQHSVILVVNTAYQGYQYSAGTIFSESVNFGVIPTELSQEVGILGPSLAAIPEASTLIAGALLLFLLGASALRNGSDCGFDVDGAVGRGTVRARCPRCFDF